MSNLVVVAIPEEQDRVWKVSSEQVPHLTILFLGDEQDADTQQIMQFVEHAVTLSEHGQFYLTVDHRGTLGEDDADVLFFKKNNYDTKWIKQFRSQLLKNDAVKTAYDSTEQYDEWLPHITLGYPESPAKPQKDDDYPIYSVCFDRIAVWAEDYNGPEFRLEWPERELQNDLAVAYSDTQKAALMHCAANGISADEHLEHFGIKGMKWGIRNKDTKVTVNGKSKMVTARKAERLDNKFKRNATSLSTQIKLQNGMANHVNARIDKLNGDFNKKYPKEMKDGTLWNHDHPVTKEYHSAYTSLVREGLNKAAADLGTSPTGKYQINIMSKNGDSVDEFSWQPVVTEVKHADSSDVVLTFRVTQDKNGLITNIEPVEDSMAQAVDLGSEFIEHFGIKGMKWGQTNRDFAKSQKRKTEAEALEASLPTKGRFGKKLTQRKATVKRLESNHLKSLVTSKVMQETNDAAKKDLEQLRKKPEFQNINYRDANGHPQFDIPKFKALEEAESQIWMEHLNKTVSGYRFNVEIKGNTWDLVPSKIEHGESVITVRPIRDADGFLIDVELVEDSMAQTADLGAEFIIEHFGIKGMKWGHRKEQFLTKLHERRVTTEAANREKRPAKDIRAYPTIGSSKRQQSRVDTKGGEDHPPTEDAIKVAVSRQKLRKSGVHALTNAELREVANRLNLEQQVANLETRGVRKSMGRQFVDSIITDKGNQKAAGRFAVKTILKRSAKLGAAAAI